MTSERLEADDVRCCDADCIDVEVHVRRAWVVERLRLLLNDSDPCVGGGLGRPENASSLASGRKRGSPVPNARLARSICGNFPMHRSEGGVSWS
jgi:hypothetical protein